MVALCVVALLTIGVVMVNSAGMSVSPVSSAAEAAASAGQGPPQGVTFESILFSRSTLYMGLALAALAAAALLPVRRLSAAAQDHAQTGGAGGVYAMGVLAVLAVLTLVYLPVIGREVNGSSRWVDMGGFGFQPSEIAKWTLVCLVAWYAVARGQAITSFWGGLIPALLGVSLVAGMVMKEDLGTGLLIGAAACAVLLAAGARFWQFMVFVPLGVAAVVFAIIASPYRVRRLTAFLDPYADAEGTGYHMIQSMVAVSGGGFFGRGLGNGLQKFGYLPEDRTDFLFAVICEELGTPGAAVVIFLFIALLASGLAIVLREPDRLLRLVGTGVLVTVGAQAVINLAVVTGLGPTKGIALPLVSSGGTGWILTAFSLGVLVAMDRGRG